MSYNRYQRTLIVGGMEAYCHFCVKTNAENMALIMGFFHRSSVKVRGIAASLGSKDARIGWRSFKTQSGNGWTGMFRPESMGRDKFLYCIATNKDIGTRYLITTSTMLHKDVYDFLMNNYKLPLLREWVPIILEELKKQCKAYPLSLEYTLPDNPVNIELNRNVVSVKDIICYDFGELTNDGLSDVVSSLLRSRKICITRNVMKPLEIESFDDYITRYGSSMADNLTKRLNPLSPLKPNVDTLALKYKSLYPQQAACVNGILAMRKNGIKYAVMNQGMGVGKTIQAIATVEGAKVEDYLKKNPHKTLRDAYEPDAINYRVIIMAPGHLVEKWASEILEEVPYAKVVTGCGLSDFVSLRASGIKPSGREFYIMSKDTAKLDTLRSPIPTQVKSMKFCLDICKDCAEEEGKIQYKKGNGTDAKCPACKGNNFIPFAVSSSTYRGMVCPSCGQLLIKNKGYDVSKDEFYENIPNNVLGPAAFASQKKENSFCYHCNAPLWGGNAKPLMQYPGQIHKSKWTKVSHYTNHAHRGRTSAFVLGGHVDEYRRSIVTDAGWREDDGETYGPRKVAPAKYIKKYLKGFFDFCILDEAHKFLGESAQAVAAHSLVKASKFTLALTGTISNGTAQAFYNLFWMLEPGRMVDEGYSYSNSELMRFCREYGCVETVYEASTTTNGGYNVMSRGKQLSPPRVKPGISPVIFGKFLMDRCLFLDITDLSKYLPNFSERIHLVSLPDEIVGNYSWVLDELNEASQSGSGMGVLSTMLQYGLSFPDKPYGREPIMDPYVKDAVLVRPRNFEQFSELDVLTPKEEELISIVRDEISEGRNCFIYATYTASAETNVTYRLKALIEHYCNLRDRVEIIQSSSPAARKREEWFHKRASEGIKVFITNPQNVETGLDFCFKYKGVEYNYPTLIFYQTGYSLATIWQASRRAYRLNQKRDCRNYYLAYEGTLQAAALEIMAKKQTATAAIQGHFTTEGLSSMAKGVDTRTQLAAALSKNDMSSRESLENMFDALSVTTAKEDGYEGFVRNLTFYELMGTSEESVDSTGFDVFDELFNSLLEEGPDETASACDVSNDVVSESFDFSSLMESLFHVNEEIPQVTEQKNDGKKKASKKPKMAGSMDIFSLFEAV